MKALSQSKNGIFNSVKYNKKKDILRKIKHEKFLQRPVEAFNIENKWKNDLINLKFLENQKIKNDQAQKELIKNSESDML